ncbi:MAG: sigma-70 family RNA polymerase sigma factor [Ignavibacteria bacterium]|nr:sigma-70 family RNA polymerase sigma factor [Ignavibacteria bacterium]
MANDEDLIWVEKVLKGDQQAFAILVKRHEDVIYTLVHRILKRKEEAEDTTQQVFIKAYQALASFNRTALFSTWLSRIAYNTAISEYRKLKNKVFLTDERLMNQIAVTFSDTDYDAEKEEKLALLNQTILRLEAEDSALITFYYTQNQSVEQISQITGLTQSNVKIKLFRIRKKLLEWMTEAN